MAASLRDRIAWLFGYRQVPFAVRGIFRYEALHMAVWGATWGCLNANFCMYVAKQSLDAPDLPVSVIGASMGLANIFAIWWGSMATRFERKRLLLASVLFVALVMTSVVLTPLVKQSWAAWLFMVQIVFAWVGVQASNTVRTSVWRTNYPDRLRGRILGRFAIWQMLFGGLFPVLAGGYLDGVLHVPLTTARIDLSAIPGAGPQAYAYVFPVGALFAVVAAAIYRRIHVRGRRRSARTERPTPQLPSLGGALAFSESVPGWISTWALGFRTGLREAFEVLREDAAYRRYLFWQMVAGAANMIMVVPLVLILAERFEVTYLAAAGMLALLPQAVVIVSTPRWSRYFDHWDIGRFRGVQMLLWGIGATLMGLGAWRLSLPLMCLGIVVRAVGESGGRLAWQLGHMAFAPAHKDALYMGVHQALTGMRGLLMPLVGAFLYRYVLDWHVLWLAAAGQLLSAYGFARLKPAK